MDLDVAERAAYLRECCGDDHALRDRVLALVDQAQGADSFMEKPLLPRSAIHGDSSGSWDAIDTDPREPEIPDAIGRFRILRTLGQGGYGIVYLAEQDQPHRQVAIKMIRGSHGGAHVRQRFQNEIAILGRLEHPGICRIYDAGEMEGELFFAMEYIDGPPITEFAENQRLGVEERLGLLTEVCEAIHHAHQRGVIHRDLKPANILVLPRSTGRAGTGTDSRFAALGQCKILDFGIGRMAARGGGPISSLTMQGALFGTLDYMSPEQFAGDPLDVDLRSDIWSLGVMAWQLVTGQLPFDLKGKSISQAGSIVTESEPGPMRLPSGEFLDRDIETILRKALSKEKEGRYASSMEMAADLRRFLAQEPILARPPSLLYQLRKYCLRHRGLALGLLLSLFVLVAGITAFIWSQQQAIATIGRDRDTAERLRRRADGLRLSAEAIAHVQQDPDLALRLAIAGAERSPGPEANRALYTAWRVHHERRRFVGHTGEVTRARLVQDGSGVLTASDDGRAILWDAASGLPRLVVQHGGPVTAAMMTPDGSRVVTASHDGWVKITSVATKTLVRQWRAHELPILWAELDAEGRRLATASLDGTARVFDLASGTELSVFKGHTGEVRCVSFQPGTDLVASAGSDQMACLWRSTDGALVESFEMSAKPDPLIPFGGSERQSPEHRWDFVRFDITGHWLALQSSNLEVKLVHLDSRRQVRNVGAGFLPQFTPDGSGLGMISISLSGCAYRELDLVSGKTAISIPADPRINNWVMSTDGSLVALANRGSWEIRIHERKKGSLRATLRGHRYQILAMEFSQDSGVLLSASADRTARLWDIRRPWEHIGLAETAWPQGSRILGLDVNGQMAAVITGEDQTPAIANTMTGTVHKVQGRRLRVGNSICLSPDAHFVAWQENAGECIIWNVADSQELGRFPTDLDSYVGGELEFSPDESILAAHGGRGRVRIFELSSKQIVRTVGSVDGHYVGMSFSRDNRRVALAGGRSGKIEVYDLGSRISPLVLGADPTWILDVGFSPDGSLIASTATDGRLRLWNARTGVMESSFPIPTTDAKVTWHPAGKLLAVYTAELLMIHELATGRLLASLSFEDSPIDFVRFDKTGSGIWLAQRNGRCERIPIDALKAAYERLPSPWDPAFLKPFEIR